MLIVGVDPVAVEADLVAGRSGLSGVRGEVWPRWGCARERELRCRDRAVVGSGLGGRSALVAARRTCCCPTTASLRRRDAVADIGSRAGGEGGRVGASQRSRRRWAGSGQRCGAGCAVSRRWRVRVREHFTRWAVALDPMLGADRAGGVAVRGRAWRRSALAAAAAVRRLGPLDPWRFASSATAGRLLSNTSCPWIGAGLIVQGRLDRHDTLEETR